MGAPRRRAVVGCSAIVLCAGVASADPVPRTLRMRTAADVPVPPTDDELVKLAEHATTEEVIMVTGSTLSRRELTTPAPLTVVERADLEAAGLTTVGDILQRLPAQSNALNAKANYSGDGATRINLRGLGTSRTLVLIDGRRVVPGGIGADAAVDLNTIPLAVIERVEVLEDGASAVYGSDAIGGVVNVITRDDFNGTEVALYTGSAQRGDGFNSGLTLAHGLRDLGVRIPTVGVGSSADSTSSSDTVVVVAPADAAKAVARLIRRPRRDEDPGSRSGFQPQS